MNGPDDSAARAVSETHQWGHEGLERDLTGMTLGDFHVERLLGRGGMGEVYLARQLSLNRPVALKVLRPDLLTKPTYLSRFEAEAAAVAKLNHPNIVHVYTLGSVDGIRYIAMEYVQGTNLRDYIRKKGALDYPLALSIMRQAGVAVGAAGEIGLIHRDIKPENLLLTKKGQVKIADFGLCRDLDSDTLNLTQTGITMGTPLYMSPEQAQGNELDHRSDLYSLGVTFYHMLAGVPPFKAETALAMALKHVKDRPPSIAIHRPDIPRDLDRLVMKLMSKSPGDRFQSAGEMLRELARVRDAMQTPSGPQPAAEVSGVSAVSTVDGTAPATAVARRTMAATLASVKRSAVGTDPGSWQGFGPLTKSALIAGGLVIGTVAGWLGRTDDLLAASAPEPKAMPGLWIAPAWNSLPRQNSAEDQYLEAQLRAPKDEMEAAWVAVPGYFPAYREWASRAYTQLARLLLRRHDAERLKALAEEIDRWEGAQTHEKELAHIARTGAQALQNDLDGVLKSLNKSVFDAGKITDPALLELCLEVTTQAEHFASRPGGTTSLPLVRPELRQIQVEMIRKLYQAEPHEPVPAAPKGAETGERPLTKKAVRRPNVSP